MLRFLFSLLLVTLLSGSAIGQEVAGFGGLKTDGFVSGSSQRAPGVITTIYSGRATYPNDVADTTGVDVINMADDGTTIRYAETQSGGNSDVLIYTDYSVRGYSATAEFQVTALPNTKAFVWFSLNGVKAGDKITEAKVHFANGAFHVPSSPGSGYFACRVDTVALDYQCLDYASPNADLCYFNMTTDHLDGPGGSIAWEPALASRGSFGYMGPRSDNVLDWATFNQGEGAANVLDILDAVQQVVNRGQAAIDRGVLIYFYVISSGSSVSITAGNNSSFVSGYGGSPALTVTTSNRRGTMVWDNGKVPIILTFDNGNHGLVDVFSALQPEKFDWSRSEDDWLGKYPGNPSAWGDSLFQLNSDKINFIAHGLGGDSYGDIAGAALNAHLAKESWLTSDYFTVLPDTVDIMCSFPGGGGQFYSMEALWKAVRYRYKANRGVGLGYINWYDLETAIGWSTAPSWDGYTNLYTLAAATMGNLLYDSGPITDRAEIHRRLLLAVDIAYTKDAKSAAMFYVHSIADGLTAENIAILKSIIDDCEFIEIRSMDEVVNSLIDRGFMDVADVLVEARILSVSSYEDSVRFTRIDSTAARQDSCATAEGGTIEGLFDQMWVGPASN